MKIVTYENDNNISLNDKVLGSDAEDSNKTKNYTFSEIKDFLIAQGLGANTSPVDSRPYKVYTALLSQIGNNAPTAIVLENTLGDTITWQYIDPGRYDGVFATTILDQNKIYCTTHPLFYGKASLGANSATNVLLKTVDNANVYSDGVIGRCAIEIRIYN